MTLPRPDCLGLSCRVVSVLCLLMSSLSATASQGAAFLPEFALRSWTKTNGLPCNSVTAVLQTSDGFLWVGTPAGLVRFDGIRFKFLNLSGDSSVPVWITDLREDPNKNLWIGTRQHGLFCLSGKKVLHFSTREGLSDEWVTCLGVDPNGNIWIGTPRGLNVWDGTRFKRFSRADGLMDVSISSVNVGWSGTVWVTTRSGTFFWRDGRLHPYEFEADSLGRNPEPLGIYEDRRNNLWAFGDTYLINLSAPVGYRLNIFRSGNLPSTRLWSFCEGRNGSLWVCVSGQGVLQFTGDAFRPFRPISVRGGKLPTDVRCMCEDNKGNLWLGTDNSGLVQLCRENVRVYGVAEGLPEGSRGCLCESALYGIIVAFADGTLFSRKNDHIELLLPRNQLWHPQRICSVAADERGAVWMAVFGSGVSCLHKSGLVSFTTANGLKEASVTVVYVDQKGRVWSGDQSGRVYLFEGGRWRQVANVDGEVTAFSASLDMMFAATAAGEVFALGGTNAPMKVVPASATDGKRISSLCCDPCGRLWIGTEGSGLGCHVGNRFMAWGEKEGMWDTWVFGLVLDRETNLYVTTAKGIFRLERDQLEIAIVSGHFPAPRILKAFDNDEIVTGGWPRSLLARDGSLWFATGRGVVQFDPRGWLRDYSPPPVYIESVAVNDRPLEGFEAFCSYQGGGTKVEATITERVRTLDFEISVPSLVLPEQVRVYYRLEGFDEDWIPCESDNRRVHYGAIPSGRYRLQVIARAADGTWNRTGASFSFVVPLPRWRSPLALALYLVSAVLILFVVTRHVSHRMLRRRVRALQESQATARERMRIARDIHDEIGSKLARVSFLSEGLMHEFPFNDRQCDKLRAIAETSRDLLQSLDEVVWAVDPRNDTLERLVAYLGCQATEYFSHTSIECSLHLPRQLPDVQLSADVRHNVLLAFKEVLANAIKHSKGSIVRVEINMGNNVLKITIEDNGVGFNIEEMAGKSDLGGLRVRRGLHSIYQRLQAIGGRCDISSRVGSGTTVVLQVPLVRLKHSHNRKT